MSCKLEFHFNGRIDQVIQIMELTRSHQERPGKACDQGEGPDMACDQGGSDKACDQLYVLCIARIVTYCMHF